MHLTNSKVGRAYRLEPSIFIVLNKKNREQQTKKKTATKWRLTKNG